MLALLHPTTGVPFPPHMAPFTNQKALHVRNPTILFTIGLDGVPPDRLPLAIILRPYLKHLPSDVLTPSDSPGAWRLVCHGHADVKNKDSSMELKLEQRHLAIKSATWNVAIEHQSPALASITPSKHSSKLLEMHFNDAFGEDDSCELVAIGLALKQFNCGWLSNGSPCNATVLGQDVSTHLKTVHQTNDTPRLECLWGGCGDMLNKGCLVRHVQEKHLGYRWPCPKCGTIFTRRTVMDTHRASCTV